MVQHVLGREEEKHTGIMSSDNSFINIYTSFFCLSNVGILEAYVCLCPTECCVFLSPNHSCILMIQFVFLVLTSRVLSHIHIAHSHGFPQASQTLISCLMSFLALLQPPDLIRNLSIYSCRFPCYHSPML